MQYFYFSWFEALHRETIVNWKTTIAVWIVWESRLTFDRKFVVKKSWWNTPNVHEFNLFVLCLSFFPSFFVVCQKWKNKREIRLDFLSRVGAGSRNHLLFLCLVACLCAIFRSVCFCAICVKNGQFFSKCSRIRKRDFETK